MTKMKCQNCKYIWDYGGNGTYYATCPRCHYKVNVISGANLKKVKVKNGKR